jgi:hypothetical protein
MSKKLNNEELSKLTNESILKSLKGSIIGDMSPESFVYWLQGFFELENPKTLSSRQTQIVKDHLALVFDKKTPDRINLEATAIGSTTGIFTKMTIDSVTPRKDLCNCCLF